MDPNKALVTACKKKDITTLIKLLPVATIHHKSSKLLTEQIVTNNIYIARYLLKYNGIYDFGVLKTEFDKLKLMLLLIPVKVTRLIFKHITKTDLINLFMSSKIFHGLFDIPLILYLSNCKYLTEKCLQYIMLDKFGLSIDLVLVYACKYELVGLAKYAIKRKANIRFNQEEALTKCCQNGNLDLAKTLVQAGAKYTDNGWFPLKTAIYYDRNNIVDYILNELMSPKDRIEFVKECSLNIF